MTLFLNYLILLKQNFLWWSSTLEIPGVEVFHIPHQYQQQRGLPEMDITALLPYSRQVFVK